MLMLPLFIGITSAWPSAASCHVLHLEHGQPVLYALVTLGMMFSAVSGCR
jgi:hypothetical protein